LSRCSVPSSFSQERLVIYCQTTSVSAAHATHCATYCTPCRPLIRAFSGWIRTPPPTIFTTGMGGEGSGFGFQSFGFRVPCFVLKTLQRPKSCRLKRNETQQLPFEAKCMVEVSSRSHGRDSNSHGARPVHLIITMIKWIRTSRLSIKSSSSHGRGRARARREQLYLRILVYLVIYDSG